MTNPTNLPDHHYYRGYPQHAEPSSPRAQLFAGLAAALTVMIIAEAILGLILVQLMLFLLLALLTVGLTALIGVPLAIYLDRRTSRLAHARASIVFGVVAFVLFGAWGAFLGYALVSWLATTPAFAEAGVIVSAGVGAAFLGVYLGTTFAMGAVAGRFVGPALSLRRRLVAAAWAFVGVVTLIGLYFWFFTQFASAEL